MTVADTKVSFIDGEKGVLIYRGYRIEELAERSSFMEVAYLLLEGALPDKKQLESFDHTVKGARELPGFVYDSLKCWPKEAKPMDVLQAAVPILAMADPDLEDESREANVKKAIRLIARAASGCGGMAPDPAGSGAFGFGRVPTPRRQFPLAPERQQTGSGNGQGPGHLPDPSCRPHLQRLHLRVSGGGLHPRPHVRGGYGRHRCPLGQPARRGQCTGHADAPRPGIGEGHPGMGAKAPSRSGDRIMGMGHAVYKTMDPRAKFLKEMGERLGKKTGHERLHELSMLIEKAGLEEFGKRGKKEIQPNVDFYSAPVYHMMGIPGDIMTPIFAISRVSGWCAHIIEEKFGEAQGKPALYRPQAEYVGQYCGLMGCTYEGIDKRTV